MALITIRTLVTLCLASSIFGFPEPHKGMIDNENHRDVGVAYGKPKFQGNASFMFEIKASPTCLPFNSTLLSIKICKTDTECTFYARREHHGAQISHIGGGAGSDDNNCKASPDNYAVAVGCGDVANVTTAVGNHFDYYSCWTKDKAGSAHLKLEAAPHDVSKNLTSSMTQ
ncbi:hypothetical protein GQ44DRAFT_624507 [Phaeosphaeriaceae sp. PMI808]|nr:hypothetical protein GQ44DRAFT_624507 [Phaeosphaeriaceae sp. PMI808]